MTAFFTQIALSNHQVGLVICRTLRAMGPQPESTLKRMLIPPANTTGREDNQQWDHTVSALKRAQLISEDGGSLVLSKVLSDSSEMDAWKFAQAFLGGLTLVNVKDISNGVDPDDFFMGVLWLSELPNSYTYSRFDDAVLNPNSPAHKIKNFGFESAISRVDQWNVFQRWARGLGLIRQVTSDVNSVDLSEFVHYYIHENAIDGSIENFIVEISKVIPLMRSSGVQNWYEMSTGSNRIFELLSPALGWALYTAKEKKLVSFFTEDDATVATVAIPFEGDGTPRLFTHIRKVA